MTAVVSPLSGPFEGDILVPADKSLTHRAYMLASIANTSSRIQNPLRGEDCESTRRCLAQLGAQFEEARHGVTEVRPAAEWGSPDGELNCGNSGTTMRLLSGLIASRPISATLVGDASLSRRPMRRIVEPLRLMGAEILGDNAPLTIHGSALHPIEYAASVASAQVKSAILFAALRCDGTTVVSEPALSRNHTELMLRALGADIRTDGLAHSLTGPFKPPGFEFAVPGDISSAAFWMVLAAAVPGSRVLLPGIGVNPGRTGILDVLNQVGTGIEITNERTELGEPVADLLVRFGGLHPFLIEGELVPRLIDEIPVLAVLATQCEGRSVIRNAEELRAKESDRIAVVARHLRTLGAVVDETQDGMEIVGPVRLSGGLIDAGLDHRIAMSFAIAGLIASGPVQIENADSVMTSYPGFFDQVQLLK